MLLEINFFFVWMIDKKKRQRKLVQFWLLNSVFFFVFVFSFKKESLDAFAWNYLDNRALWRRAREYSIEGVFEGKRRRSVLTVAMAMVAIVTSRRERECVGRHSEWMEYWCDDFRWLQRHEMAFAALFRSLNYGGVAISAKSRLALCSSGN